MLGSEVAGNGNAVKYFLMPSFATPQARALPSPPLGEESARIGDLPVAGITSRRWFAAGVRRHTLPPTLRWRGDN
jgi:hypothetical protein